jgi:hypothetical protein
MFRSHFPSLCVAGVADSDTGNRRGRVVRGSVDGDEKEGKWGRFVPERGG